MGSGVRSWLRVRTKLGARGRCSEPPMRTIDTRTSQQPPMRLRLQGVRVLAILRLPAPFRAAGQMTPQWRAVDVWRHAAQAARGDQTARFGRYSNRSSSTTVHWTKRKKNNTGTARCRGQHGGNEPHRLTERTTELQPVCPGRSSNWPPHAAVIGAPTLLEGARCVDTHCLAPYKRQRAPPPPDVLVMFRVLARKEAREKRAEEKQRACPRAPRVSRARAPALDLAQSRLGPGPTNAAPQQRAGPPATTLWTRRPCLHVVNVLWPEALPPHALRDAGPAEKLSSFSCCVCT